MNKEEFFREMYGVVKDGIRDGANNRLVEEVLNERWLNIGYAAEAMIESEVGEEQVQKMLMKYWDLRPSEAKEIYEMSKNNYVRSQR